MSTDLENLEYKFGDYRMSNSQQILFRGAERVPLSTKIYYLLLTLVENTGRVLSKDEIIETVWPGQVVTDTALAQQILRLRQVLEDNNRVQPLIETHRGVGYRFTAPVEILNKDLAVNIKSPKPLSRWLAYAALVVTLVGTWFIFQNSELTDEDSESSSDLNNAISLAIIPSKNNPDWLNKGGLDYLARLLGQYDDIHTISPEPEWYSSNSPEKLAIRLTTSNNIDYSSLIDISETGAGFKAEIMLRTDNEIISSTSQEANTLPGIFKAVSNWIRFNLLVRDRVVDFDESMFTTIDSYALQSYLQGHFEATVNSSEKKALEYFQAAVNKDGKFIPAWLKLAESNLKLGDFNKALSITNTLKDMPEAESGTGISIELNYIRAWAWYRLGDLEKSRNSIEQSVDSINLLQNPYKKLNGLRSLSFLAGLQEDWDQAEAYTLERISLSKEHLPLPNQLADLYMKLADIYMRKHETANTRKYLNLATDIYQETNNSDGMIYALYILNKLNFEQNLFDKGVQVTTRAQPYLDASTNLHYQMYYLQFSALILNTRGYFDRSHDYADRMKKIAVQTNNPLYMILAEFVKMHAFYLQDRFEQAVHNMESMQLIVASNTVLPEIRDYVRVIGIWLSSRIDPPEQALIKLQHNSQAYQQLNKSFPNELARAQGHIYIRLGEVQKGLEILEATEQSHREKLQLNVANYIGYEILETLLEYPELDYTETLARLESHVDYHYTFFKIKAKFSAREGNYLEAAMLMQENKLRANQLWKPEDQLLLEDFQQKSM